MEKLEIPKSRKSRKNTEIREKWSNFRNCEKIEIGQNRQNWSKKKSANFHQLSFCPLQFNRIPNFFEFPKKILQSLHVFRVLKIPPPEKTCVKKGLRPGK